MKAVDLCDPNVEPTDEELEELVASMHKKVMERKQKADADFFSDLTAQMAAQMAALKNAPDYDDIKNAKQN